jgi:leader peptidase (prepilin peptidase)/N-methyltransferase
MRPDLLAALVLAPVAGSFLGALASRAPDLRSALSGRSRCDACGTTLGPAELVPLLSWAALRGRCRHCGAAIGAIHPALELGCLAIAIWAGTLFTGWALALACLLGWVLLALATIDVRTRLLPDPLVLAVALGGLVAGALAPDTLVDRLIGAGLGGGLMALVAIGYERMRGRAGLGWGDVKLVAALGLWVGWQGLPGLILCASLGGLGYAGLMALIGRPIARDQELPFGPFIAAAGWLVFLYGG